MMSKSVLHTAALLLLCFCLSSPVVPAHAADCTVINAQGPDVPGSLRRCLSQVTDGDTITFNLPPSATEIAITEELVATTPNLTITGPGAEQLTIRADGCRIFSVTQSATITGLTITGAGSVSYGGGIYATAPLTVEDCTISDNVSGAGGGIASTATALTVRNCTISNNQANANGGAILCEMPGGNVTVDSCTIHQNSAHYGGGIFVSSDNCNLSVENTTILDNTASLSGGGIFFLSPATLSITTSTIHNNTAEDGDGGGLHTSAICSVGIDRSTFSNNDSGGETYTGGGAHLGGTGHITNSLFMNNSSVGSGGAISFKEQYNEYTLINCTVHGNSSDGDGGGIYCSEQLSGDCTFHLNYCTITGNTADADNNGTGQGGGLVKDGTTTVLVKSCAVAENLVGTSTPANEDCAELSGTFSSHGYNLIGAGDGLSGFADGTGNDQVGTAASPLPTGLEALSFNGGVTRTRAFTGSSLLRNAGGPAETDQGVTVLTDQRGSPRQQGWASDIGAYEASAQANTAILFLLLDD